VGPVEARALASLQCVDIYARAGEYKPWVFVDPEDSSLYDFNGMSDEMHAELNSKTQYRVACE
jgi:hypothetical protein